MRNVAKGEDASSPFKISLFNSSSSPSACKNCPTDKLCLRQPQPSLRNVPLHLSGDGGSSSSSSSLSLSLLLGNDPKLSRRVQTR